MLSGRDFKDIITGEQCNQLNQSILLHSSIASPNCCICENWFGAFSTTAQCYELLLFHTGTVNGRAASGTSWTFQCKHSEPMFMARSFLKSPYYWMGIEPFTITKKPHYNFELLFVLPTGMQSANCQMDNLEQKHYNVCAWELHVVLNYHHELFLKGFNSNHGLS